MTLITPLRKIVDENGAMMPRMEAWVELVSKLTNIDVQDEGISVSNPVKTLNFVGGSVSESPSGQANINISGGGGGVTTFDGLTDTPASKATFAFDFVRVNAGETDLEYHTIVPADIDAQPVNDALTSISGLVTSANKMIYTTAPDTYAITSLTSFGRSLIDDVDAAAARSTLNVDVAGTDNSTPVTLAGAPDYITIVGQVITRALINLTSHITGILPLANGGTNDAAVTSDNINHVKAMDQDVGTTDDHTMNKAIINDTTDASVASTGAAQVAGGLDVRKTIISGAGIKIGGTGESNRLDFFRELAWVPVASFAGGSGTITYASQSGTSTKFGDTVSIRGRLTFTSIASRTGNFTITGLPYISAAQLQSINIMGFGLNLASAGQSLTGFVGASGTTIHVFVWNNINGANALQAAQMTNITDLIFDIQYKAA